MSIFKHKVRQPKRILQSEFSLAAKYKEEFLKLKAGSLIPAASNILDQIHEKK